jgi:hypothetical protein
MAFAIGKSLAGGNDWREQIAVEEVADSMLEKTLARLEPTGRFDEIEGLREHLEYAADAALKGRHAFYTQRLSWALDALGRTSEAKGDTNTARAEYQRALKLCEYVYEDPDLGHHSVQVACIANELVHLGELTSGPEALELYQRGWARIEAHLAKQPSQAEHLGGQRANVRLHIGWEYSKQHDEQRARAEFQAGLAAAKEWRGFEESEDLAPRNVRATLEKLLAPEPGELSPR